MEKTNKEKIINDISELFKNYIDYENNVEFLSNRLNDSVLVFINNERKYKIRYKKISLTSYMGEYLAREFLHQPVYEYKYEIYLDDNDYFEISSEHPNAEELGIEKLHKIRDFFNLISPYVYY